MQLLHRNNQVISYTRAYITCIKHQRSHSFHVPDVLCLSQHIPVGQCKNFQ